MTEAALLAALCRSVHSLSRRSEVVVGHADLFGLPAVAAGANTLGSGWHTKQRICAPSTYQANDPEQVRRQARWMTYGKLLARLHSQESDILISRDRTRAERLYSGPVDPDSAATRMHHLDVLHEAIASIISLGSSQSLRVAALRALYESSAAELRSLAATYGRPFRDIISLQLAGAYESLRLYATHEGIW